MHDVILYGDKIKPKAKEMKPQPQNPRYLCLSLRKYRYLTLSFSQKVDQHSNYPFELMPQGVCMTLAKSESDSNSVVIWSS